MRIFLSRKALALGVLRSGVVPYRVGAFYSFPRRHMHPYDGRLLSSRVRIVFTTDALPEA